MSARSTGQLFVLSGPSGVGKGSIVRLLIEQDPSIALSVSMTTRPPREGEVDGIDYRFVTAPGFQEHVDADALLEWAEVFGHRYGTPAEPIDTARAAGQDVVLEIDVQGATTVRSRVNDAILIFIEPPSRGELERRLLERGTEKPSAVAGRLAHADEELGQAPTFDHRVVNDDLEEAVAQVAAIIQAHRSSR